MSAKAKRKHVDSVWTQLRGIESLRTHWKIIFMLESLLRSGVGSRLVCGVVSA